MSTGQIILMAALAGAVLFGMWRVGTDGRFRGTRRIREEAGPDASPGLMSVLDAMGAELGERATLVQFSSAFCAPCRATRRVLGEVAGVVPGVRHVEVDAEQNLALVRELRVLRTPTTLVLDAQGREVRRATGLPRKEAVLAALGEAVS